MNRDDLLFRAALTRFVLGAAALILFPVLYPLSRGGAPVYIAYLVWAAIEQVLIRKGIGGVKRSFVAGLVDAAVLTYTVHSLGSVSTVMASMYFALGVLNAIVVSTRVGMALALLSALAYDAIVWGEHARIIPFAPHVPELSALGPPNAAQAATSCVIVTIIVLSSTMVVGVLVDTVHRREQALVEANQRLEALSQRDSLTGLFNRRYVFERLELELERVKRGHALSVLMVDLDHFKRVNDNEGHLHGDMLLKEVSGAIAASVRVTDVVGRYGGDEFVVILPDGDGAQARSVGARIASAVKETSDRVDAKHPVTASVGVAVAIANEGARALLRRADDRAYEAKHEGGDRVAG